MPKKPRQRTPPAILAAVDKADSLYRAAQTLATTAKAHAWGILGAALGYVAGSALAHSFSNPLLGRAELVPLGYAAAVAVYAILSRTFASADRCLDRAKLYFAAQKITLAEYKQLRVACLKKAGLIGK